MLPLKNYPKSINKKKRLLKQFVKTTENQKKKNFEVLPLMEMGKCYLNFGNLQMEMGF